MLKILVTFFLQFISAIEFFSIIFEPKHQTFFQDFFIFHKLFFISFPFASSEVIFIVKTLSKDGLLYQFVYFIFLLFLYIFLIIKQNYYLYFIYE
jgi:hypothetical protein